MRRLIPLLLVLLPFAASAQNPKPPTTLRGDLLEQLHTTHNQEDWFVPISVAVDGLTAEQAKWTPGKDNHSVGQLAYHLWFWDARALAQFKGEGSVSNVRWWKTANACFSVSPLVSSTHAIESDRTPHIEKSAHSSGSHISNRSRTAGE